MTTPRSAVRPELHAKASYDVLTVGRLGIDLYPLDTGRKLRDVERFGRFLGDSATNVAVAAARHGLSTAVVSGVGDDPFGDFALEELAALGVDHQFDGSSAD